jgi:N-methylhydantoinase B
MSFELNWKLAAKRPPLVTSANIDAVTASIIRGALETACFESAAFLGRAASSPVINQSNERNASILDSQGRLAAVSIGTPQLTYTSQLIARYGLMHYDEYDWGPGDLFLGNDPDYGGGHLPDYNVYAPIYDDNGELVLIQALQAHQGDTGGKDPGGFTLDATDIFTEGLAIPCLKIAHRGERRRDVIKLLARNNRFPAFAGDLEAMMSAVEHGSRLCQGFIRKWGTETIKAAINYNIDHTEKRVREDIASWQDGVYEATVFVDHDTVGNKDVKVHVTCTIEGDAIRVDLTGTDDRPELVGVWNTFANTRSYIMTQFAAMIDPNTVKNEGLFYPVEMVIPENTIVHPPINKPAALGSFHPACEITEAVCAALSNVVPERAAPQIYKIGMPPAVIGFDENGQMWLDQGVDSRTMDVSAVEGIDGWGTCPAALGALFLAEAEDAEGRVPIINLNREMTIDTGGAGQWRGQPGSLNSRLVMEPTMTMAWVVSQKHPMSGMCGGDAASPYILKITPDPESGEEIDVDHVIRTTMKPGAKVAYQFGGGAGFGPRLKRDPEAVKEDVLDELVSVGAARDTYGVILTGTIEDYDLAVDWAATEALRRELSLEAAE